MKKLHRFIAGEGGAVPIVEAAFVYPIVIFVVIIFFFLGSIFYQNAKVESIAVRAAEKLAAYYPNPMLYDGIPTSAENLKLDPYRCLFGNSAAETKVKKYVQDELNKLNSSGITQIRGNVSVCEVDNYVIYQTARVEISYTITYKPLELIDGISVLRYSTVSATSSGDPAEFIRNIDMILDYAETTGLADAIRDTVGKFTG